MFEVEWKTYDEWQDEGFQVKAGERSDQRDAWGNPLFHEDQVFNFEDETEYLSDLYD